MKWFRNIRFLTQAGLVAAIYTALCMVLHPISFGFGGIELRVSEALTLLPAIMPAAVPGLFVGCLLSNILGGATLLDIVFGSLATLLAAISARALKNIRFKGFPFFSLIMPVIFNGLIVGAELTFLLPTDKGKLITFVVYALEVAAGELAVCIAGGIPLFYAVRKTGLFNNKL